MAKMKDLYHMLQTGEYYKYKEAYELAEAEGVTEYLYKGQKVSTALAKYKVDFVELFLKSLTDDNIRDKSTIHPYFISERDYR
jgi:hypothetical protein